MKGFRRAELSAVARKMLVIGFFLAVLLISIPAAAQQVVVKNVYYFQPPADGSGLLSSWGSEPIGTWGFYLGAYGDFEDQPLEWTDPEAATHILFYNQIGTQFMLGFGILDRINLSGVFTYAPQRQFNEQFKGKEPYSAYAHLDGTQYNDKELENLNECTQETDCFVKTFYRPSQGIWEDSAMGDVRLQAKYMFQSREIDQWGLAALVEVGLPTGDTGQFVSDECLTVSPRAIFDIGNTWWSYVLNVGYKYYSSSIARSRYFDIQGGNELILSTGGSMRFLRFGEVFVDFQTRSLIEQLFSNSSVDYGELLYGFRGTWLTNNPVRFTIGGGVGILDGVGTPLWRVFFGLDAFIRELGKPKGG